MYDEKSPRILTSYNEAQKTLDNATTSYKLDTGFLEGNTSKTFTLRLWMDEMTPPVDEVMNKIFKSKVTIISSYKEDRRGTLKAVSLNEETGETTGAFWEYKENITKVVFENELNPKETDLYWDVSEAQDGSVMSYLTPILMKKKMRQY